MWLRKCKGSAFESKDVKEYNISKSKFKKRLMEKEKGFFKVLSEKIDSCRDLQSFWHMINKYRIRINSLTNISVSQWHDHFSLLNPYELNTLLKDLSPLTDPHWIIRIRMRNLYGC